MNSTRIFPLLKTIKMGAYELPNRVAMAAMTRMRADPITGTPNDLHIKYYSERAEGSGFILTECSPISTQAEGFPGAAGIYKPEHIEGWKKVNDAVHQVNGRIFLQIWHSGRTNRIAPVGPSPIAMRVESSTSEKGWEDGLTPKELTESEILQIVEEFRVGAENALRAGFDGIQLHGANGYLIDEFLRDCSNKRNDQFGGSIENRCKFPLMVMDALISVFGADKIGIKLSPVSRYQDMYDSDPEALMKYLLPELSKRNIAFVELYRPPEFMPMPNFYGIKGEDQMPTIYKTLRQYFNGVLIANNSFDWESGNQIIESGEADMVTFGRPFISNPDLIQRWVNGWDLNVADYTKFFGGGAEGYCDYPKYEKKIEVNK